VLESDLDEAAADRLDLGRAKLTKIARNLED
jgi:hypothetical protein